MPTATNSLQLVRMTIDTENYKNFIIKGDITHCSSAVSASCWGIPAFIMFAVFDMSLFLFLPMLLSYYTVWTFWLHEIFCI